MKITFAFLVVLCASLAGTVTVHRSFRGGYPAGAQGVTVRQQPNAAALTAPKMAQAKTKASLVGLMSEEFYKIGT